MPKTLIVYAHPNPKSFNHAIVETATAALQAAGHEVRMRDLYALNFNPVLSGEDFVALKAGGPRADVKVEQDHVTWADNVVFVYPMWWGERPAILKGYIDRVFSSGFAYSYGPDGAQGLLGPRKAAVIQTVGGPEAWYSQEALQALVKPMTDWTLYFSGFKDVVTKVFFAVPSVGDSVRHSMLDEVKAFVKGI
jgi:NAD(P)H dehydrogenase (quinone)